jgi:hypothetical protein
MLLKAVLALTLPASAQVGTLFEGGRGPAPAFRALEVPAIPVDPNSDWAPAAPDSEPGDTNPGAPERSGFWERMQGKAFDQICKSIKLRTGQGVDFPGYGGARAQVERKMERTAAGTFALIDRIELSLNGGLSQSLLSGAEGGLAISVGTTLKGESMVVRPLGTKKSCDELGRLVNVLDMKAAIPLSPNRIREMKVGELWRIPMTLHIGVGLGASAADLPASVSFGRGKEGRASVTLYRLAEDQVRFRLRIDKADVRSKGGDVVYSIPGVALGLPATDTIILEQLAKLVDRQIARTISRYLTARLGLSSGKRMGRMLMIEYVLDPRDEAEMTALRELMRGDLNALTMLRDLVSRAGRALIDQDKDPVREEIAELVGRHSGDLERAPTFVGADDYERDGSRFAFKLPILWDYENASGRERDEILILDEDGGGHRILKADKRKESGLFDVPFLGEMVMDHTQKTAQVISSVGPDDSVSEPAAVYVVQEGFLRKGASTARDMAAQADDIASLIGARGEGRNARTSLPVEALFPKDSLHLPERAHGPRDATSGPQEKTYHRGISAFTLTFSREAVADIVSAPADVVLKSYVNALGYAEQEMMKRVLPLMSIKADGSLEYSRREAERALGYDGWRDEGSRNALAELSYLAEQATDVIRDLAAARDAKTPSERAERFRDAMAGDGRSGLAYEEILKVMVQLVDPADVSAEFFVNVEKRRKGEKDVAARLLLNAKAPGDGAMIGDASRDRARFAEPSVLVD